jgi:hypothetical protein
MRTAMQKLCELGSLLLLAAVSCFGQATQSATPQSSTSQSTNGSAASDSAAKPTKPADEKKRPKKVWTNDDLSSVKGSVNVVGDGKSAEGEGVAKKTDYAAGENAPAAMDARKQQVESYRSQIKELQSQIDAADQKISELRNFKAENAAPSGGINPNKGYNMVPLEDQIKQLEDKKKQCLAKIDDVEVEAGKNGIEPGELR